MRFRVYTLFYSDNWSQIVRDIRTASSKVPAYIICQIL